MPVADTILDKPSLQFVDKEDFGMIYQLSLLQLRLFTAIIVTD